MASTFIDSLKKKLSELNATSQSIQTLSLLLIHHRKHHKDIVQIWLKELQKASDSHKLTLMFLANDVIQNSRKKGPEYLKEFGAVMPKAFGHVFQAITEKNLLSKFERIINVWEERNIYDGPSITSIRASKKKKKSKSPASASPSSPQNQQAKKKKRSIPSPKSAVSVVELELPSVSPEAQSSPPTQNLSHEILERAIMDLENCPSTDAIVREKIAQLPPEVSDTSLLEKIQSRQDGEKLSKMVTEALSLLNEYNERLSDECVDRRTLTVLIKSFLDGHSSLLVKAEKELKDVQEKLRQVMQVRQELKSHLSSLPDLTRLPSVTGGLPPLPTAENLFQ